jgi:ribonuclease G
LKTEIIINSATQEARIAILEEGRLVEILVERPDTERAVGNIYKGIVTSILPGMQAAFVDIGMEKSAFLHARDVGGSPERLDEDDNDDEEEEDDERRPPREAKKYTPIQDLLTKGQEVIVQITKEPIGTKGPRVTTDVSLPGRFSVLMPYSNHVGVSRKISSWGEKRRLKQLANQLRPDTCGIIVRTVAEGQGEDDLTRDIGELKRTWERVHRRAKRLKAPALIHTELGMTTSLMRDLLNDGVERVVVDSKVVHRDITKYLKSTAPRLRDRVILYEEKEPVFDAYGIELEIANATNRRVPLRKGGFLVIDHTEAMVTIDVNTGRYVGRNNQEQTILNINLEAGQEIARQLRLRDIGGIIVIDFIDMGVEANRRRVWEEFSKALRHDRSRINVAERLSEFGVLEMTRQRVRPSLLYTFSEPCPLCKGSGRVQSPDTTVTKLERWLKRLRAAGGEKKLVLEVHPTVGTFLREKEQRRLKALRRTTGAQIILEDNGVLEIDAYRFSSLKTAEDLTGRYEA